MPPQHVRDLGLRVYREVIEQGKLEVADELVAPDCIDISPLMPCTIGRTGSAPLKYVATMLRGALSEVYVRVHEFLVDGNTGIARITIEGMHEGNLLGGSPTGRWIAWDAIDIIKVRDGKIREHYGIWDGAGLMQQLGVLSTDDVPRQPQAVGDYQYSDHG